MSCLPTFRSNDMIVIDDDTIAFRNGPGSVYINHMQGGGCLNLDGGRNTLVTRTCAGGTSRRWLTLARTYRSAAACSATSCLTSGSASACRALPAARHRPGR
jgi:hypothetical protein